MLQSDIERLVYKLDADGDYSIPDIADAVQQRVSVYSDKGQLPQPSEEPASDSDSSSSSSTSSSSSSSRRNGTAGSGSSDNSSRD